MPRSIIVFIVCEQDFSYCGQTSAWLHCYTDDSQLYLSFCPNASVNQDVALARMESCIDDIRNWMLNDKLKLNEDKTDFLIIGTSQQLAKVTISSLRIGNSAITPVSSARNLRS